MDSWIVVLTIIIIIVYYCFTLRLWFKFNKKIFSYIVLWLIVISLSIIFYVNRKNILNNQVLAAILPSKGYHNSQKAIYYKASDGHFYIDVFVGKVKIKFIVDTGASGIAITPDDAIRLGVSLNSLHFTEEYETASGIVRAAPAIIPLMQIGNFILRNVKVSINESSGSVSLMGMSVLEKFNIHISSDKIILSQ